MPSDAGVAFSIINFATPLTPTGAWRQFSVINFRLVALETRGWVGTVMFQGQTGYFFVPEKNYLS